MKCRRREGVTRWNVVRLTLTSPWSWSDGQIHDISTRNTFDLKAFRGVTQWNIVNSKVLRSEMSSIWPSRHLRVEATVKLTTFPCVTPSTWRCFEVLCNEMSSIRLLRNEMSPMWRSLHLRVEVTAWLTTFPYVTLSIWKQVEVLRNGNSSIRRCCATKCRQLDRQFTFELNWRSNWRSFLA